MGGSHRDECDEESHAPESAAEENWVAQLLALLEGEAGHLSVGVAGDDPVCIPEEDGDSHEGEEDGGDSRAPEELLLAQKRPLHEGEVVGRGRDDSELGVGSSTASTPNRLEHGAEPCRDVPSV